MKLAFISAAALIALSGPSFAQAAKTDVKPADVAKVVAAIQADKAKVKTYCDMQKLYDQSYEASDKKDEKKAEELGKKADELRKQLGPDYEKIDAAAQDIDPESKEGQEFYAAFEPLDKACQQ